VSSVKCFIGAREATEASAAPYAADPSCELRHIAAGKRTRRALWICNGTASR
jgi:hypothetical protein